MSKIEIYTKDYCGYCAQAKTLLRSKGLAFEETDITYNVEQQVAVQKRSGRRTVPQIFVDGTAIGGFDDLVALNGSGQLDAMVSDGNAVQSAAA